MRKHTIHVSSLAAIGALGFVALVGGAAVAAIDPIEYDVTGVASCTVVDDLFTIVLTNHGVDDIDFATYEIIPDGTGTDEPSLGLGILAGGSSDPYFTDSDSVTFVFSDTYEVTVWTTGLTCASSDDDSDDDEGDPSSATSPADSKG